MLVLFLFFQIFQYSACALNFQNIDLVFIDADKTNYIAYYERALRLVSAKGLIAIDNIFWNGKVIDKSVTDAQTREIRKLNERIAADTNVHIALMSIADGLFLIKPIQKSYFYYKKKFLHPN